jgi:hypothetical protein
MMASSSIRFWKRPKPIFECALAEALRGKGKSRWWLLRREACIVEMKLTCLLFIMHLAESRHSLHCMSGDLKGSTMEENKASILCESGQCREGPGKHQTKYGPVGWWVRN